MKYVSSSFGNPETYKYIPTLKSNKIILIILKSSFKPFLIYLAYFFRRSEDFTEYAWTINILNFRLNQYFKGKVPEKE